jgi:hypothetical protein
MGFRFLFAAAAAATSCLLASEGFAQKDPGVRGGLQNTGGGLQAQGELPALGDVWITPAELGPLRPDAAEQTPSPMTSIGELMPTGDVWPIPDRAVRIVQPAAPAETPENVEAR